MGQLVFQAALGGQVNLVGPNTASTFNLNVPAASDTLVGEATTNTLTNKTLASPAITGVATFAAGSAAAPAITTTGDTNTGIFFPAADTIAFSEGGVESMRISSAGNVGIGTTAPSGPLNVVSASSSLAIAINGRSSDSLGAMYFYANNGSTQYATITTSATEFRLSSVPAAAVQTFYTNGSERMRLDASGSVIVGGTSTSSDESTYQGGGVFVSRRASSAGTTHANFLNGGSVVGSITSNTTTTFYNITSDYRLKENATPVTTGLQTIAALNPVNFNWVSNRIADTGFLAHEFQAVIPNSVMGTKDAIDASGNPVYQQIDRSGAIPFLVAAIKEQQALITAMTARIEALENK